jgi:sugar O-acyltransferase (sialic acid O-acetyltransferase NeuD family)
MSDSGLAPRPLLIFPFNGNGVEALDCLGEEFRCIGFIDDDHRKQSGVAFGYHVYSRDVLNARADAKVLAVPGSPTSFRARAAAICGLAIDESRYAQVVDPKAVVSGLAALGHNVLLMAGVVITSNVTIGSHVCVLPNTVIHHDTKIGDWSLIGSNVTVAGEVTIGRNSYIGSGTSIRNGVHVGDGSMIGLGSTVIADVEPGAIVAGNPARLLAPRGLRSVEGA